jgi:hypothetical protein
MARPMPLAPPVTITTFPVKSGMVPPDQDEQQPVTTRSQLQRRYG